MLAGSDLEVARLDVIAATTGAYYRVLAAQERKGLADELLDLAERFASTVQARVDAGKVSPVEATRASIEVSQTRIQRARAVRDLEAARVRLAASWGSSAAAFDEVVGVLPEPCQPPSLEELRRLLMQAPDVERLEIEIQRQLEVQELERSFRLPDLTVSVGPRRFEESGRSAWVAGVSLPLPIFDRNQGSRRAAEFETERVRRDAESIRITLEAEVAVVLERLCAAAQEANTMGDEVVPAAQAAFAATEIGYSEGKFGFLDVLDAQRALFEARSLLLASSEEYALTRTELERIVGAGRDTWSAAPGSVCPLQGEER